MRDKFLPFALPDIGEEEIAEVVDSMRSGMLLGSASMMDGMIMRYREVLGEDATVVATGGLASLVVPYCKTEGIILDDGLLLDGLYAIYKKNQ